MTTLVREGEAKVLEHAGDQPTGSRRIGSTLVNQRASVLEATSIQRLAELALRPLVLIALVGVHSGTVTRGNRECRRLARTSRANSATQRATGASTARPWCAHPA